MNMKIVHQYFELKENTRKNTIEIDKRTNAMKRYIFLIGLVMNIARNDRPAKVIKRGHKLPAYSHDEKLQYNARQLKRKR
ncbi:MAG: hypothetical protein JXJ19_00480 [Elusimicrobia bacterium]|nr:hypothetical protein [Elusimicrobiota bacterium]